MLQDLERRLYRFIQHGAHTRSSNGAIMFAAGSTQGPHRERNEDRAAVAELRSDRRSNSSLNVAIVCDGMGGLQAGDRAASIALSAFLATLTAGRDQTLPALLTAAILRANEAVFSEFRGDAGTTLSAVVLSPEGSWAVHAGDSRIYSLAKDGALTLVSTDDTIQGAISAHQGDADEDSLDNRLLQFVGIGESLNPHLIELSNLDVSRWLITTDGIHGMGRKVLEGLTQRMRDPSDLIRRMTFVADALNVGDNASAACINAQLPARSASTPGTEIAIYSPVDRLNVWIGSSNNKGALEECARQAIPPENISPTAAPAIDEKKGRRKTRRGKRPPEESATKVPMDVIFEQSSIKND